jgi:pyruvate ferredoxin oxidoreductase beta subunit
VYSACPTGWRCASDLAIELGRLAAQTCAFPIYEIFDGHKVRVNVKPERIRPLKDYLSSQGRFRHLDDETITEVEARLRRWYERLLTREAQSGWDDESDGGQH